MDNTPPRNGAILFYAVLAVVTLVALKPLFDSYFDIVWRGQVDEILDEGYVGLTVSVPDGTDESVAEAVEEAAEATLPALRTCYGREALDGVPPVGRYTGTLSYRGRVLSFQDVAGSLAENPTLTRCVTSALQAAPTGGMESDVSVNVRLDFAGTPAAVAEADWRQGLHGTDAPGATIEQAMAVVGRGPDQRPAVISPANDHTSRDAIAGWQELPAHPDAWADQYQVEEAAPAPTETESTGDDDDAEAEDAEGSEGAESGGEREPSSEDGADPTADEPASPEE